jgi:hypothetical protein
MHPAVLSDLATSKIISFDFFDVATEGICLFANLHADVQIRANPIHTVHELQGKATRDDAIELGQPLSESERVVDELLESMVDVPDAVADHLLIHRLEFAAGAGECDYVLDGKVRSDGIENGWISVRAKYGGEVGHAELCCWLVYTRMVK